jgi:hypothetical protein
MTGQAAIDAFVARHFTWPGTLHLHRAALGPDILRAPVNVVLSPVLILCRLAGWGLRRAGRVRTGEWLLQRRLLLRTDVAARVEAAVLAELIGVPCPPGTRPDRAAMAAAIDGALRTGPAAADRIVDALAEYTGTRSALAEFTTALLALAVGGLAFQALTPGMISMAPGLAGAVSQTTAIADFPLGETLGAAWYGVFPVGPSPWLVAATMAGLVMAGAVVGAFAGTLADPVQARLGMHRRRLQRLMATIEAERAGRHDRPFVAREHLLARGFDLWDAALSVLRLFR